MASCPPIYEEGSRILHPHVAQKRIVAPFRLVADDVFLTEVFSFDDNFTHEFVELFLVIRLYTACKQKHTHHVVVPIGFAVLACGFILPGGRGSRCPILASLHFPITVAVAPDSFHPVFRFERGQMILDGVLTFPQQLRHLAAGKVWIFTEDIEKLVLR
jgi:hypothetical protein